jgi:hypothetical protein
MGLSAGCPLRCLRHTGNVSGHFAGSLASETFRDISEVVAHCSSTAAAIAAEISLTLLMIRPIFPIASKAPLVSACIAVILRDFRRLLGQLFHFVRDNRKAFPRFSSPRRLDGRIQCQQIRLLRDRRNHLNDLADLRTGVLLGKWRHASNRLIHGIRYATWPYRSGGLVRKDCGLFY